MTNITITGNTTGPAELRFTPQGVAEALGEKGMRVTVAGKVRTRDYERRDGGKGISLEVTADEVAISIPRQRRQPQQADSWSSQQQAPSADPWATPGQEAPF